MKTKIGSLFCALTLLGALACEKKADQHEHDHDAAVEDVEVSPNQQLYDEVMKIHDEVMPKMEDVKMLQMTIKKQLNNDQSLSKEERARLESIYATLDSADNDMRVWMRNFRPLPDSLGEERAREYLENEMERIKKVRDETDAALDAANGIK